MTPGGYAWWYVDGLSDDHRHAITVIGFVGSVFSPYYRLARRRPGADPEDHVAINVALYGPGGAWTMTERGRASLRRDAATFAVGPSAMAFDGSAFTLSLDEIAVPLPRRVRGTVRLEPAFLSDATFALDAAGRHTWRPIAPFGRIAVEMDSPRLSWRGSAYLDHNAGEEPLEDGFRSWTWTRTSHPGGADVAFATEPRAGAAGGFAVSFDRDGAVRVGDAPGRAPLPRTLWAVPREGLAEAGGAARLDRTLLDTPFYARSVVTTRLGGREGTGLHETLLLDRFRAPVVQAMLPFRMPRRTGAPPRGP